MITAYVPNYISTIDFTSDTSDTYQYWRKEYRSAGTPCFIEGTKNQMAFYVKLERPTLADLATMTDSFDICVRDTWGMSFKAGTN